MTKSKTPLRWPYLVVAVLICSSRALILRLGANSSWADLATVPGPSSLFEPAALVILGLVLGRSHGWDHRTAFGICAASLATIVATGFATGITQELINENLAEILIMLPLSCATVFLGLATGTSLRKAPDTAAGPNPPELPELRSFTTTATAAITDPRERADAAAELYQHATSRHEELVTAGAEPHAAMTQTLAELGDPVELSSELARAHRQPVTAAAIGGILLVGLVFAGFLLAAVIAYLSQEPTGMILVTLVAVLGTSAILISALRRKP